MKKLLTCFEDAFAPSVKTTLWLLKIMVPISLAVILMQHYGVIAWLSQYLNPVFQYLGLPGASAIAFLTAASVTTYAGLAVMMSMALTMREATILAVMMVLCHALPLECAVINKVGSNPYKMGLLRIMAAFIAAFGLNFVLPSMPRPFIARHTVAADVSVWDVVWQWACGSVRMSLMILVLIYTLMVLQRILERYNIMRMLVVPLRPVMRFFGLPENAAYLWLVGNVLGISYGSAAMLDLEDSGQITREEANEVNYHLIMNHSMLEDTMTFGVCGVSAVCILSVRMLFAFCLVWGRKGLKRVMREVGAG
uniref:Nucleoside recognition protein n=1 Tax=uncultured Prevotella sp. TaxID=159272 RepID=A0A6G8F1M7_9BACT|nr:nucleoside recognition protein [uncultured Prevotella sp.]